MISGSYNERSGALTDLLKRRIYVASSWRNSRQPEVVRALREVGHHVYDFRNPSKGDTGFAWSDYRRTRNTQKGASYYE